MTHGGPRLATRDRDTAAPTTAIDLDLDTDAEAMRALLQQRLPGFATGRLHVDALSVHDARALPCGLPTSSPAGRPRSTRDSPGRKPAPTR